MTQTATFTDHEATWVEPTRKNGARKLVWTKVEVIDTLTPISISFGCVSKTFYLRGKEISNNHKTLFLYTENGEIARGSWKHGHEGSLIHNEPLEIWGENRKLIQACNYQNGRVKDSRKYLLSI